MQRREYPRPQFVRNNWINLNGEWNFDFDDKNVGMSENWYQAHEYSKKIMVPYVFQTTLSQLRDRDIHKTIWYQKKFNYAVNDKRMLLHFGASDYDTMVWVDGQYVGRHVGGYTSFSFDISNVLNRKQIEHLIVVRVFDPVFDETIPRGKQNWTGEKESIWYDNYTGIWQTVWLEPVNKDYIDQVKFYTNINTGEVTFKGVLNYLDETPKSHSFKISIKFNDKLITETTLKINSNHLKVTIDLFEQKIFRTMFHDSGWMWSPEHPVLFDCTFELIDDMSHVLDYVESYFGMREIKREGHTIFLNNQPLYQKLVLNQGYWKEGGYTAPDDIAFKKDIALAKDLGFNGCRMHQKVEDPRFLFWADHLGFLVWGECASNQVFVEEKANLLMDEWREIIDRDFNHPSIITWLPLNESWGVPQIHNNEEQQHFSEVLYHMLKMLDPTRLVNCTDGWEQTHTDICGVHNYAHGEIDDHKKYEQFCNSLKTVENIVKYPPNKWHVFAEGYSYENQPVILTEFGGIELNLGKDKKGWGYTSTESADDFYVEYRRTINAINDSECLVGFCYTQLYDVEQEMNGLLTVDRIPKVNVDIIKEINESISYQWSELSL